jgi:hypothetical protein
LFERLSARFLHRSEDFERGLAGSLSSLCELSHTHLATIRLRRIIIKILARLLLRQREAGWLAFASAANINNPSHLRVQEWHFYSFIIRVECECRPTRPNRPYPARRSLFSDFFSPAAALCLNPHKDYLIRD